MARIVSKTVSVSALTIVVALGTAALAQQAPQGQPMPQRSQGAQAQGTGAPGEGGQRPAGAAGANGGFGGFTRPVAEDWNDHQGWQQIFDGKTLNGWEGIAGHWSVEDGAIVGRSSDANPAGTTNLIWRGGEPANFRMRFEFKLEGAGANGGFQFRGKNAPLPMRPPDAARLAAMTPEQKTRMEQAQALNAKNAKWSMWGYQADFDAANRFTGQLYDAGTGRAIMAWRGDAVAAEPGRRVKLGSLGTQEELAKFIQPLGEWNQMEVVADGHMLMVILNGHVTSFVVDTDPKDFAAKGVIAFELEGPGDVKISHRNIWMKQLP